MTILDNSYLEINTSVLKENIRTIAEELPKGVQLIPVLKDDAYGMGAGECMRAIEETGLSNVYAVSHIAEALKFRELGLGKDIMALALPVEKQLDEAIRNDIIITLGYPGQLETILRHAETLGKRARIQIKIDTGLHRIGFQLPELQELVREMDVHSGEFDVFGTFSHFAENSDEMMALQYGRFMEGLGILESCGVKPGIRHIASSASFELAPQYSLDAVRIGRRLYMDNPVTPTGRIKEVPSFRAFIADIRQRNAGDTLGYGGTTVLECDSRVAVLNIGYGDGLNRRLVELHGPVLVNGVRCPILSTCMDQCNIDVTGVSCRRGDEVTLFGRSPDGGFLSSQEVSGICDGDEGCGLTSALSPRVRRVYI